MRIVPSQRRSERMLSFNYISLWSHIHMIIKYEKMLNSILGSYYSLILPTEHNTYL